MERNKNMHVVLWLGKIITLSIPLSCATRLAFRDFLPLATSLSVTVVHIFILKKIG
jgi:hypothetical protein